MNCPCCLSPVTRLGDGVPWGPCGVWEAYGSSLKETKIPVLHRRTRSDSLCVGRKPTFAPGKEKMWTTHCPLCGEGLFGGCMEHRHERASSQVEAAGAVAGELSAGSL